ncbi:heme biosynthesis HemY N-terminal domain-containing protein [Arenimonas composti]|uniref:HemY N-terminal domain-containing protein n=1 Tax=Arenimonas composti TR7-09 = DSM 18010 TaxID=1121013 RepID=A0A091BD79_9GAMM|nr:heme biosynthesis HemY N-terminal domain-containing protein [Arenimonas composti]KFN50638.1 hypothetical protein P873_05615 [Arenimonas composti TR7-09 = DSM 18010]
MSGYRTLVLWLALAALGALGWSWFAQDLGDVVIRFRGWTVTTTLFYALVAWLLLWFLVWALAWVIRLPLRAWRRHARLQARNRLVSGMEALHEGRWTRAESLLAKAADDAELRTPALLGARRAAEARGDVDAVARHHGALLEHAPATAALEQAMRLVDQGRHDEALATLATLPAPLSPRALWLQARALAGNARAAEAVALLPVLRREQVLAGEAMTAFEHELAAAALAQAVTVDELLQRWDAQPARIQNTPAVVAAYARRAAALGLEDEAAAAVAVALDAGWDSGLALLYGRLPPGRGGADRLARAEAWLPAHSTDPALLVSVARLAARAQSWARAEDLLHRAIAQGGGAQAWEDLGDVHAAQGDPAKAQQAYANAMRLPRGEAAVPTGDRDVRARIADRAVPEQRNALGLPVIPRADD